MNIELINFEQADGFFKAYFRKTKKAKLKKDELFPRPNPILIVQGVLEEADPVKVIVKENEHKLNVKNVQELIQKYHGY